MDSVQNERTFNDDNDFPFKWNWTRVQVRRSHRLPGSNYSWNWWQKHVLALRGTSCSISWVGEGRKISSPRSRYVQLVLLLPGGITISHFVSSTRSSSFVSYFLLSPNFHRDQQVGQKCTPVLWRHQRDQLQNIRTYFKSIAIWWPKQSIAMTAD